MQARRTSRLIVSTTALAVILAGCGEASEEPEVTPAEGSTEQAEGESTAATDLPGDGDEGGSEGGAGQDPGGGAPADIPTVPADYADALVVAWGAGDQATMETLGTAEVVHILGDGGGPNWEQVSSEEYAASTSVTYANSQNGDTLALSVDNAVASEGAEQAVIQAKYTTAGDEENLPTEPVAYADALVVAWGAGEQELVSRLATPEVLHILGDGGGPHWDQTGSEGAAGSTHVTYENTESGDVLTLRVDNAAASEGGDQAVVEASYDTP